MADDKLTFTFTKKATKRQLDSGSSVQFRHDKTESGHERDFILAVSDKEIESVAPKKAKTEYVIPMTKKSGLAFNRGVRNVGSGDGGELVGNEEDKEAAEAIMKDLHEAEENILDGSSSQLIQMLQQQRPLGDDESATLASDLATRPEESNLDEYESMPIEHFGAALMRGMGWKEGAPIGLTNKQVVKPIEYVSRPPGKGLGAQSKQLNGEKSKKHGDKGRKYKTLYDKDGRVRHVRELDEELSEAPPNEMKVSAFVHVVSGFHEGFYGMVTSLDEDTAHAVIEVPNMRRPLTISQHNIEVVTEETYKKGLHQSREEKKDLGSSSQDKDSHEKSKSKHRQSTSPSHKSSKKSSKGKARDVHDEELWLHPNIRVRVVSKRYRKGAFYNEKVSLVDVISTDTCICKTDDGDLLEDMRQDMLETVVPKQSDAVVCIVLGKHKGQLGKLVEKNKSKCQAIIQLIRDQTAVKLNYDQIAEYTGNPEVDDDYR